MIACQADIICRTVFPITIPEEVIAGQVQLDNVPEEDSQVRSSKNNLQAD